MTLKEKLRSLRDRWRSFRERMPIAGKLIISSLILIIVSGSGVVAYTTYDFTQNNPSFCNKCHIMNESFEAWQMSEHASINCHDCHKLPVSELNDLMVSAIVKRTEKIPVRYDKVIVPWKTCIACHWEENKEYPNAVKINTSRIHAKHYFMEKIECSKCHGYKLHKFLPEEDFCLKCHESTNIKHEGKMGNLACLNCHTDRTVDLKPARKKCLFCHGERNVINELFEDKTIDVTHFRPPVKTIKQALKIEMDNDSPMQFHCNTCHKPHGKIKPQYGECMSCHSQELNVGVHGSHVTDSELVCIDCHKPHTWRVTRDQSQGICTDCHDYIEPKIFMGACS